MCCGGVGVLLVGVLVVGVYVDELLWVLAWFDIVLVCIEVLVLL